jgi:adenylylsulfate kinase|tara:strand:+ start:15768 stop:16502 length:735 start_codon:yes stop_codon:yes gene_type:complete
MIDSPKRNFMKAFTWKIIGFVILSIIAFTITNSLRTVGVIGIAYHLLMIILYFFHEKLWERILWGKSKGLLIQMTGMSGAGKTTLANQVQKKLVRRGLQIEIIDGDEYRKELCEDLGFSKHDRKENIKRLSYVGKILSRNSVVSIMSAINPYDSSRERIRNTNKSSKLVYVKCSVEELMKRDTKGLYHRALLPDGHPEKVYNFTGISDPFEEPKKYDLLIETDKETLQQSVTKIERFILKNISK